MAKILKNQTSPAVDIVVDATGATIDINAGSHIR